jgi:hypothetical protein
MIKAVNLVIKIRVLSVLFSTPDNQLYVQAFLPHSDVRMDIEIRFIPSKVLVMIAVIP